MTATHARDVSPTTCRASISLVVGVTSVAESAVSFLTTLLALILDTTIGSHSNLCIVKSRCFFNLLLDLDSFADSSV